MSGIPTKKHMPQQHHLHQTTPSSNMLLPHLVPLSPGDILAIASQSMASRSISEAPSHPSLLETATDLSCYFLHSGSCAVYLPTMEMCPSLSHESNNHLDQYWIDHGQQLGQSPTGQPYQYSRHFSLSSALRTHKVLSPSQTTPSASATIASPISNHAQPSFSCTSIHSSHRLLTTTSVPTQLTGNHRRRLSPDETEYLLQQYHSNKKPTAKDRSVFAAHLNLHPRTIQVWFQNRRAKLRRENDLLRHPSNSQGTMRSAGENDTQNDLDVQDVLNGDNQPYSNICDISQDMDTEQVGGILQHQQTGKNNNDSCSPETIPTALSYHERMEIDVVAPYLQWDHEIHRDHGHLFQPWLLNELTTSHRITSSRQRPLMRNGGGQVLPVPVPVPAETSTRPGPPLSHSPDRNFSLIPSASAEQATSNPYQHQHQHKHQYQNQCRHQQHRQPQQSRQQLQQKCSTKRNQRRPNSHANGVRIEIPRHQKALTLVASHAFT